MLYVRYRPIHPTLASMTLDATIECAAPKTAADIGDIKGALIDFVAAHWPSATQQPPLMITLLHWEQLDG